MQLIPLIVCSLLGFMAAHLLNIYGLQNESLYLTAVSSLLVVGLYASTYGISLREAHQHLRLIVSAVTIGVFMKAAIIGGSLALLFGDPFFLILGVVVAQIDPLSVAGLLKGNRLSKKAKTIIAAWASFDDPVTVIMALYVPFLVMSVSDVRVASVLGSTTPSFSGYAAGMAANILFAGTVFGVWKLLQHSRHKAEGTFLLAVGASVYVLLAASLIVAVAYFLMLGIAFIGLFLRPAKIDILLDRVLTWVLRTAIFMIGLLLVDGIAIWKGMVLGIVAYSAQIIVGWLLTRHFSLQDRLHISFAQQNGVTAIVLALIFEPIQPGTVAVVVPAIIVINSLHVMANKGVDNYLQRKVLTTGDVSLAEM